MDYDKCQWRRSDADPLVFVRHMVGVERFVDFENRYMRGQHTIIGGFDTVFNTSASPNDVLRAAQLAWAALRFTVPIIAAVSSTDASDEGTLLYRVASSSEVASVWAERTVRLLKATSWYDAHRQLSLLSLPDERSDQTFVYIVPRSATEYTFILFTSHTTFDGAGVKATMSHFFSLFARYLHDNALGQQEVAGLKWGREYAHLLPAFPQILADAKALSGPEHDRTAGAILQQIQATFPNAHSYRAPPDAQGPDIAGTLEHQLSKAESRNLLQYAKSNGFTLNELVHAAVNISALHDNPSGAEDATFVCLALIDARSQLRAPYSNSRGYLGLSLCTIPIVVPLRQVTGIAPEAQLHAMATGMKRAYGQQKSFPALLGASAAILHPLIDGAKAGSPPPPVSPWYVGDGILERDIDMSFKDGDRREILQITMFHASVRQTDSVPIFRCSSVRGSFILTVDYNGALWSRESMEGYMRDIVSTLLSVGKVAGHSQLARL